MDVKVITADLKSLSCVKSVICKSGQKIQIYNQPTFWDGYRIEVEFVNGKRLIFFGPDFNNEWRFSGFDSEWYSGGISPLAIVGTVDKYYEEKRDPTAKFSGYNALLPGFSAPFPDKGRTKPVVGDVIQHLEDMEQKKKLQESLRVGYPTQDSRLLRWFFYDQPDSGIRKVLVEVNQKEVARERRDIRIERRKREGTPRVLGGRLNCEILYPSGRRYWGRVHVVGDLAVIEPDKPDTAAWVLNLEDVEFDKVVDLRKLTYTRVIHNKVGINFLKQIIRS